MLTLRAHKAIEPISYIKIFNHLQCKGNYSATSNNVKLVHWPLMGGLLHKISAAQPSPLFAVPNVTAHPSTASVPIAILLYIGLRF